MKCTESQIREVLENTAAKYNFRGNGRKAAEEFIANHPKDAAKCDWESLTDMENEMKTLVIVMASTYRARMI